MSWEANRLWSECALAKSCADRVSLLLACSLRQVLSIWSDISIFRSALIPESDFKLASPPKVRALNTPAGACNANWVLALAAIASFSPSVLPTLSAIALPVAAAQRSVWELDFDKESVIVGC